MRAAYKLWLLVSEGSYPSRAGIGDYVYRLESYLLPRVGREAQHWPLAVQGAAARHYLEAMELEWDWLEEVVAALSWENPLWLDSRLVMEPLKSSEPITSV